MVFQLFPTEWRSDDKVWRSLPLLCADALVRPLFMWLHAQLCTARRVVCRQC
jgi:hypothetical protein